MLTALLTITFCLLIAVNVNAVAIPRVLRREVQEELRKRGSFTLPLTRRYVPRTGLDKRGAYSGVTGLGDFADLCVSGRLVMSRMLTYNIGSTRCRSQWARRRRP